MANVPISSSGWREKFSSAIQHSNQYCLEMVPFVRDELQHLKGGGGWNWRLAFWDGNIRAEGRKDLEKEEGELTSRAPDTRLCLAGSNLPFFPRPPPPRYPLHICCACVSRRIRRQHGGGGA